MQEKMMLSLRLMRLPGMTSRARRLLPLAAFVLLLALSLHLYAHIRLSAAQSCQSGDPGWTCRALRLGGDSSNGDGRPIVDRPEGVKTASVWAGSSPMLEGVNGALSDFWAGLAEGLGRPGVVSGWRYERDAEDVDMSRRQCLLAFPGLFVEIDRARSRYERFHIVERDIQRLAINPGRVRAAVLGGKLQLLETNLPTPNDRARALAYLRGINEAVSQSTRTTLPDIEFIVSVNPRVPDLTYPIWTPDRREEDDKVWLMPDMGYAVEEVGKGASARPAWEQGKPEDRKAGAPPPKEGEAKKQAGPARVLSTSRRQLIAEVEALERGLPFEGKRERLVGAWRASAVPDTTRRRGLLFVAEGQDWAESEKQGEQVGVAGVQDTNQVAKPSAENVREGEGLYRSPLAETCRPAFLAHDDSFGIGLLDGPLLCTSVVITTRPKWIVPYHGLMLADPDRPHMHDTPEHPAVVRWSRGEVGRQNVVVVADDWADLPEKVKGLKSNPAAAERIATNNADMFRRRYLTAAATACYWRELVVAYARVGYKPKAFVESDGGEGSDGESKEGSTTKTTTASGRRTRRGISFASFLLLDTDTQARFHEEMMLRNA